MQINILRLILTSIVLLFLQYFFLNEINFGTHLIRPLPYIWILLNLPIRQNKYLSLIIAFVLGFLLDMFSNSRGMHACASVTMVFVKNFYDTHFLDIDGLDREGQSFLTPSYKGWPYYLNYAGILTGVHHLVFFTLNYYRWSAFFSILFSVILSGIVTLVLFEFIRIVEGKRR